jgi:hypothetical protein
MARKTFLNIQVLEDLPNIGKSISGDLRRIGIIKPEDLRNKDAFVLYNALCDLKRKKQDPCVLDVFMSAISFVNTGKALPWWHFTEERKAKQKERLQ